MDHTAFRFGKIKIQEKSLPISQPKKPSPKPKIFGHLITEVIRKGTCVSCGACVAVCPVYAIELESSLPKLAGLCVGCGMCYANCPSTEFQYLEMDNLIYGRIRKEEEKNIGVFDAIYAVKAKDDEVLKLCQDGGAVSAILLQFLSEEGDGAVITGIEEEKTWFAKPIVASTKKDILSGAGTKYTPSPTLIGVSSAVKEHSKENLAVVGTPCQMRALTKIQSGKFSEANIKDVVKLKIGLLCMETFNYDSFIVFLKNEGINASNVNKFEIKSGRFLANSGNESIYNVKLSHVKKLVRPCCHSCGDFTSEYSDLSIGNVGSPNGWSTVIVRTQKGKKVLEDAEKNGHIEIKPIVEGKKGIDLIYRLAKIKKNNVVKGED